MRTLGAALIVLATCIPSANAEEAYPAPKHQNNGTEFGLIEHSVLTVSDEVSGNCWTNSSAIRSKIHLIFEQNGIYVPDYKPAFFNFRTVSTTLSAFGFRNGGKCSLGAEFRVSTVIYSELGGGNGKQAYVFNYGAGIFDRSAVFTSGDNANSQLTDFFEGAASEFVAKTISARRDRGFQEYVVDYPSQKEPPMSQSDWDEFISSSSSSSN